MASKPTFVLIPGAWHPAEGLDPLAQVLEADGYPTRSTSLLSAFSRPDADISTDAAHIRDTLLLSLVEEGKDIVLVLHSYAGFPGAVAIKGLSERERAAQGLKGGVLGVVFMCAFAPVEGMSLINAIGGTLPGWMEIDETGLITATDPIPVFYHDCDENAAKAVASTLGRQSLKAFQAESGPVAYVEDAYAGRRGYIRALHDRAIPVALQDAMIQGCGVKLTVKEIDTAHSPFLNKPRETATILEELAKEFAAAT